VTDFIDVYLPSNIRAFPWISAPRHATSITAVASGHEHRNKNWLNPLRKFTASEAVRCHETIEDLKDHWLVCSGPFLAFPMRDPLDFASARLLKSNLAPDIVATDQVCGIADGLARDFQLKKTYTRGGFSYVRKIRLPILDSVLVAMNALDPSTPGPALPGGPYTYSVDRLSGAITFDPVPQNGIVVTAGYYFDVPVRFETDDEFEAIVKAFQVDGFSDLTFMETRMCGQGESE
jgi:uncharacterized protein (TIGR02217 family)